MTGARRPRRPGAREAAAFGLHGFAHLGMCAVRRGYVSGGVSAPAVIALRA